jgi:hypothetical protein
VTPTYEEQQAARKARLKAVADRLRRSGNPAAERAEKMADAIASGEERGNAKKAALAVPSEASVAERPDVFKVIGLLTDQLRKAEANRSMFKEVHTIIRQNARAGEDVQVAAICQATSFSQAVARDLLKLDCAGRLGFPPAMISANNANIRRLKDHISVLGAQLHLETREPRVTQTPEFDATEYRELQRIDLGPDEELQRGKGRGRER